jgi:predicted MFS family arabinose efflux permease
MCSSIGGVVGALIIGKFAESVNNPKKYACIFLMIAGVSWLFIPITLPFCFVLSYPLIFISNSAINMMNVMFISLLQKQIDQSLLGRVSTFTESLVSVMVPIGNFLSGILLLAVSPLCVELLYGIALILCSVAYILLKVRTHRQHDK